MFLNQLHVKGFRCFKEDFEIHFHKGLNVIVGENGAGKTAIISAIRQLFQDSESGRYSISEDDFAHGFLAGDTPSTAFQIKAYFTDLNIHEKTALLTWSDGTETISLTTQVNNKEFRGRYKKTQWGGISKGSQFDSELLDLIHCIYLPPLRDAESKLVNGRQSRLSKLLKAINKDALKQSTNTSQPHPLVGEVQKFNDKLVTDQTLSIKTANDLINKHLLKAIGQHLGQQTKIQFAESDFMKIVESLTLLFFPNMSQSSQNLFRSLTQNSLGYNNLLYIASILAELTLVTDNNTLFKLLLIEEPEAHLHPQLQIRLLEHLKHVAEESNVQIIVTSHSTVLVSSVSSDQIIHLSKHDTPIATPLRECGLLPDSLSFLNRWLDVTKSNLLFASGVILVEGIAEQMIIPALAKIILKDQPDGQRTLEDMGISVINLNGIYFKHFMQLYCNLENDDYKNIPIRCAGITDADPPKSSKPHSTNIIAETTNHSLELIPTIAASKDARLFKSTYKTLEYDLAMEGNNIAYISDILKYLWPKPKKGKSTVIQELTDIALIDWTTTASTIKADLAHYILEKIDSSDIGKGAFAQMFADKIDREEISNLVIPDYIQQAVLWAANIK